MSIANLGVNNYVNTYQWSNIFQHFIYTATKRCFKTVKIIISARELYGL